VQKLIILTVSLAVIIAMLIAVGCDKEKIVESTEYVHDIEYVTLPPDTVFTTDTVYVGDSVAIHTTDTVMVYDTVIQVNHVYDTIVQVNHVYDTMLVYDTVTTVQHHYDTTVVVDTILTVQCDPNEYFAVAALHYHCDPLVFDFVYQEFGENDGWVYYLSTFQLDLTKTSDEIYDIYGYIDYWTTDFSGYYPLEFYWRMVHTGGDPADPRNWQITDPPVASSEHQPGFRMSTEAAPFDRTLR